MKLLRRLRGNERFVDGPEPSDQVSGDAGGPRYVTLDWPDTGHNAPMVWPRLDIEGDGHAVSEDLEHGEADREGGDVEPLTRLDGPPRLLNHLVIVSKNFHAPDSLHPRINEESAPGRVNAPYPNNVVRQRQLRLVKGWIFRVWYDSIPGRLVVKYQYRFHRPIRKRKLLRRSK